MPVHSRTRFRGPPGRCADRKSSTERLYRGQMRYCFGDWMARPLDAISRRDVEARFHRISERHGRATGNHAISLLRSVYRRPSVDYDGLRNHAKRASGAPTCSRAVQTYLTTVTDNPLRTAPRGNAERRLSFAAHRAPVPAGKSAAASGQCPWRRPHGDRVRVVYPRQSLRRLSGTRFVSFDSIDRLEAVETAFRAPPAWGRLRNPPGSGRRFRGPNSLW